MEIYLINERPSALPAAAAAFGVLPRFAGAVPAAHPDFVVTDRDRARDWAPESPATPRHSAGFGGRNAVGTDCRSTELLADVKTVIEGTSVSALISGYAATVQMARKQVSVGTAGVGGDPPRGRPI